MNSSVIQLRDLVVSYHTNTVLDSISLDIEKGSMLGVIGPNGAGKSTLLKAIMNLVTIVRGDVQFSIEGKTNPKQARKLIAYVPQTSSVHWDFPATVLDIVVMGRYGKLGWFKRPGCADYDMAKEMLHKVDMLAYANRQLYELSGGEQQRIFLAWALAQESEVYLLDEPFKGVDVESEKAIIALLQSLQGAMVVVHHALQTVPDYFDHVALINKALVVSGRTEETFTEEQIENTYHYAQAVGGGL